MFKFLRGGLAKRKQTKDGNILCLLQSIFLKQKQDRVIPFPIIVFFYGSNSGIDLHMYPLLLMSSATVILDQHIENPSKP